MTPALIAEEAASLDHHDRWPRLVTLGRQARSAPALASSLTTLAASPVHHERLLALMAAHGSQDAALITALAQDPSNEGTAAAIALAAANLDDDALGALVPQLSRRRRRRLFQLLLACGRAPLNDRLHDALCASADVQEQAELLPYLSSAAVQRLLDIERSAGLDAASWGRLARQHPAIVMARLQALLQQPGEPSWLLRQGVRSALDALRASAPDQGLVLLQQATRRLNPHELPLGAYAPLFPAAVAVLVLDQARPVALVWKANALRQLDEATLVALAQAAALPNLPSVFARLLPAQRLALYQACGDAWRDAPGALPLAYVEALPRQVREAEAQHAWALPRLQSNAQLRLPYLAFLPLEQARRLAEPFLSQPDGELRALAVTALVKGRRYRASELDALLAFCGLRDNEQDPVRLAMIDALANLQPTRWQESHLPSLKGIIDAALRARDCSPQTMAAAARLLLGLVVPQTDFVIAELPALVERNGSLNMASQESRLNDTQMRRIAPRLIPLLKAWVTRNHSFAALSLIRGFGRRARAAPEFTELMIALTSDQRGHVARSGLQALLQTKQPSAAARLIPQLLENDESWIQVHEVAMHLHTYRQTLLTRFLKPRSYSGRFNSGLAATLPSFDTGFARWTPAQQSLYAQSLQDLARSGKRSAWELYAAVQRLGAMPSLDVQPLLSFARLDAKDKALRDKALEALGRCDAGRGVPALLEALDDERARVAIYALRRSLLAMPAAQALPLLASVQANKVTVLKEVIRLAGELGGDAAFAFLNQFAAKEQLHPDAQIALLRAYWSHLHRDEVWPHLHAAARSERAALARSTIRIPRQGLSSRARQQLSHHLTLLLQHPDAQVSRETLERLVAMPLGRADEAMLDAINAFLDDADTAINRLAAQALLMSCTTQQDARVAERFATIGRAPALQAVAEAYEQCLLSGLRGLEASAGPLVAALLQRCWQPGLALRLAITQLTPTTALARIADADSAGLLHPGAVATASQAWSQVSAVPQSLDALDTAEAELRTADSAAQRRLGLALLAALGDRHGWNTERHALLHSYHEDPELWVSDAAELMTPPSPLEAAVAVSG